MIPSQSPSRPLLLLVALVIGLLLGTSLSAIGQAAAPDEEPIVRVVTATRIPQKLDSVPAPVEVIEREDLAAFGADTIGAALRYMSSIPLSMQEPTDRNVSVNLRGAPNDHTLILVDGLPVTSAQGGSELSELPLAAVERIEIVRGPSSAVWGSQAAAGVINIITMRPETAPRWNIQMRGGTLGRSVQLVHGHAGPGGDGIVFSAQRLEEQGRRPNSDVEATRFTARMQRRMGPSATLDVNLSYSDSERGSPGPLNWQTPRARYGDRQFRWSVNWLTGSASPLSRDTTSQHGGQRWHLYGLHYDKRYNDPDDTWNPPSTHRNHAVGLEWARDVQLPFGQGHIGAALRHDQAKSTNFEGTRAERWTGSVTVEAIHDLSPGLGLVSGLRLDGASNHHVEFSPRLGLLYETSASDRYRAQVGRVFRLPTFDDLYWYEPAWNMFGNPNLRPESGWAVEVGGDHRLSPAWSVSWTGFHQRMRDLIRWVEVEPFVYRVMNIDNARMLGVELSATYRLNPAWEAALHYTYVDAKNLTTGQQLAAPHEGKLNVTWRGAATRWTATARHRSSRKRDLGDTVPAYTVVSTALRHQVNPHVFVQLDVDNVFDVAYEESRGFPMPGRTVSVRVGYEF